MICRSCEHSRRGWGEVLCRHPETFVNRKKPKNLWIILSWGDAEFELEKGFCKGKKWEKTRPFKYVRSFYKMMTCHRFA